MNRLSLEGLWVQEVTAPRRTSQEEATPALSHHTNVQHSSERSRHQHLGDRQESLRKLQRDDQTRWSSSDARPARTLSWSALEQMELEIGVKGITPPWYRLRANSKRAGRPCLSIRFTFERLLFTNYLSRGLFIKDGGEVWPPVVNKNLWHLASCEQKDPRAASLGPIVGWFL